MEELNGLIFSVPSFTPSVNAHQRRPGSTAEKNRNLYIYGLELFNPKKLDTFKLSWPGTKGDLGLQL